MLADYSRRDLRVRGVRLEFGRVRLVGQTRGVVHLRVIDRLGPMTAVSSIGLRDALPRDRATRHDVVLRRTSRGWRIASVRTG
jgi:hypothetical protein